MSGAQIGGAIGAVVGAWAGGNWQLGYALGSAIGGFVSPEQINGPRIGDIAQQTSAEGVPCPLFAGTAGAAGNLIYKGPIDKVYVKEQAGKGGGPVVKNERLYCTFAIRIGCSLFDGPGNRVGLAGIIRIWEDGKLVYDVSPESTILEESAAFAENFHWYAGTETQLPDPWLEAIEGTGNVPAYRGRSYIVIRRDVTDRAGAVPQYQFEVTVGGVVEPPGGIITPEDLYTADLTLADYIPWVAFVPTDIAVSDDGEWVVGCRATAPRLQILRRVAGVYTVIANPSTMPSDVAGGVSWSSGGELMAVRVAGSQRFIVYRRDGETFTALDPPASLPTGDGEGIALSPNGQKIAVGQASSPHLWHYWIADDEFLTPQTKAIDAVGYLEYSPDGTALAVAAGGSLRIYDTHSSSSFPLVGSQATGGGPGWVGGITWGYGGAFVVTGSTSFDSGHVISVYPYNAAAIIGDRLDPRLPYATPQPATPTFSIDANADGTQIAVGLQNDSGEVGLFLYDMSSAGVLTEADAQPEIGTSGTYRIVRFTDSPSVPTVTPGVTSLDQIILATGRRCKMPASLFDVAHLSGDAVAGSVVASQNFTAQDFLNSLRWAYLLDGADYDGQIHFPKRGGANQFALTDDDLVDEQSDGEQDETLRNGDDKRMAPIRRPLKLSLMFPNRTVAYQLTKATSPNYGDRGDAVSEVTMEVPVVLNDTDEAPQLADKLEKISRADAEGEIVRIVHEGVGAKLTAGDVGTLTERGLTRRLRVETYREGSGTKRLLLRVDRPHAVQSQIRQQAVPAPPAPPPALPGLTEFVVLNIPGIYDGDDRLGIRIGVAGRPDTAWSGAMVRLSTDDGASWTNLMLIDTRAQIGTLLDDVSSASEFYPDRTNVVRVEMLDDRDLESLTEAQWLSEGNGAAIAYADGSAELIQFRDAQDDGDNEWTLSTLQRGRLATSASEHGVGAKFVMLDGTVFVPLPSSLIGQELLLQFVSANSAEVETAPTFGFTWDPAASQTEFPASNLLLERDADTITAAAIPRHRFGTEDSPIASANFIGYRFTATDGIDYESVDTGALSPTADFDVTGWASPVTVTVALLNRITGAGPTISEDIA